MVTGFGQTHLQKDLHEIIEIPQSGLIFFYSLKKLEKDPDPIEHKYSANTDRMENAIHKTRGAGDQRVHRTESSECSMLELHVQSPSSFPPQTLSSYDCFYCLQEDRSEASVEGGRWLKLLAVFGLET